MANIKISVQPNNYCHLQDSTTVIRVMDTYFKTLHRDDQSAAGGEPAAITVDPDQRQLTL